MEPPAAPLSSAAMAPRSPARFLAPLALVAFGIALFMVVTSSSPEREAGDDPNRATETRPAEATPNGERRERKGPRRYRVKPGDTPSSIAEKTGVPLEEILRLNPDLDPQTLAPGQRIKLRQ
jgi:LysM domain